MLVATESWKPVTPWSASVRARGQMKAGGELRFAFSVERF
jgi:hypothetical protein